MKLLLYCTKAKPYLYHDKDYCFDTMNTIDLGYKTFKYTNQRIYDDETGKFLGWANCENMFDKNSLNGKIVAECDFEVEKIRKGWGCLNGTRYFRNNVNHYYPDYELEKQSCLSFDEIDKYLKGTLNENCGYAIHIKNLHIFDKPRELNEVYKIENVGGMLFSKPLTTAPQNMMRVSINHWEYATYEPNDINILISIRPEWLCKILNGEKTIEVRKKVLKGMINND